MEAKFILSKNKVLEQYNRLKELGIKVSYSYKTNREVGNVLQDNAKDCYFSVHDIEEIDMIKNKDKIFFFVVALTEETIELIINKGIRNFVVDNEEDLNFLLNYIKDNKIIINLILRMKFQEHIISSGKYFLYGMESRKINDIISKIKDNKYIDKIGVHIHRKSQNASEWEIKQELIDSLTSESLERINLINLGGGIPIKYKTYQSGILDYILKKIIETSNWLAEYNIETFIEPGRFIAGPSVILNTEINLIVDNVIILNTSIYNCALDSMITNIRMEVGGELNEKDDEKEGGENMGKYYMIKGNSPTRDDIFRYKVKLRNPKRGDKIVFLNAGAYNYTTDFCSFKKLKTEIVD